MPGPSPAFAALTYTLCAEMKLFDNSYPSPAENLAADEALLDWAEADESLEVLRFWESTTPFVVVGYGNSVQRETNVDACARLGIPILRRCSGGGTVVQGPGCLNYAVILQSATAPELESITGTNCYVMRKQRAALESVLETEVSIRGATDLTLGDLKISGNAQRRKRRAILFHGAILLNFDLALISATLQQPSREPDYRGGRPHSDFLTNVGISADVVKRSIASVWRAHEVLVDIPTSYLTPLVEKHSDPAWNLKF